MKSVVLAVGLSFLLQGQVGAQTATLSGLLGNSALLIVDGKPPKIVAPGQTYSDVKVISTEGDSAVVEIKGVRQTLRVGATPVSVGSGAVAVSGSRLVLNASSGGHYFARGQINGQAVQFMLDTGSTFVTLGAPDAARLGINYKSGQIVSIATANGTSYAWRVRLQQVKVGDVILYDVEASVVPNATQVALLGNSFLSRFQMTQANGQMVLDKLY